MLLKNDVDLLPLAANIGTIAVIGTNARSARIMGGGSAQLSAMDAVSPCDSLAELLGADRLVFAEGCTNYRWEPLLTGPLFISLDLSGAPLHSEARTEAMAFWIPQIGGGKVEPQAFSARSTDSFNPDRTGTFSAGVPATSPGAAGRQAVRRRLDRLETRSHLF